MLSVSEIQSFINNDNISEKKKLAGIGQRYYEAEHDIKKCRLFYYNADGKLVEDTMRANSKISHPFFTELADQLAAYMLSFDDNPIRAKATAEGLQEHLDRYFDDDFWSETSDVITGAYIKGFEYVFAYKNAKDKLTFQCADSMGVVECREKDTEDQQRYMIYHYMDRIEQGRKVIRKIQVWSESETYYYVQEGTNGKIVPDESEPINPRPHIVFTDKKTGQRMGCALGYIPFWRLDYNKKQLSGLKPIKDLIDDYDIMECGLSNNLKDFDTPLFVVKGFQGDNLDELQQNLKTKKIVGTDPEGGVEIRTVDIPYQARKTKADEDEKNIYRFGMGFNSSQVGDGNITNIVIKSRYALLDLKARKLEKRLNRLLKQLVKVVLDEINLANGTGYQITDVSFVFQHNIITNDTENTTNEKTEADTQQVRVNTIMNIAAQIGDEQTLKALCDVMDWDYDSLKDQLKKEEASLLEAKKTLGNVVPEDIVTDPPALE